MRDRVEILEGRGEEVAVVDEVAESHAAPVLSALRLQGVSLHLVAVWVDALTSRPPALHPVLAALQSKVAAEVLPPLELLRHVVVGEVPAGVLHQRHGYPGVDRVLGVSPRHRLVLKQSFLPVSESRALLSLVLQLSAAQFVAAEVFPHLLPHPPRHHHVHLLHVQPRPDVAAGSHRAVSFLLANGCVAPLSRLQPDRKERLR